MEKEFVDRYGLFGSIKENYLFIASNPRNQKGKDSIHWIAPYMSHLYRYCKGSEHITEIGINQVNSTWAFLYARPKKLVSIDIDLHRKPTQHIPEFNGVNLWLENAKKLAKDANIDFQAIEADSASIEIEQTDVLFIDSLHTGEHLRKELTLHSPKVNKKIILHDTTLFGRQLWPPIQELLNQGKFKLLKRINTGCGLTILQRKQF